MSNKKVMITELNIPLPIAKYISITGMNANQGVGGCVEFDLFIEKEQLARIDRFFAAMTSECKNGTQSLVAEFSTLTECCRLMLKEFGFKVNDKHLDHAVIYELAKYRVKMGIVRNADQKTESAFLFDFSQELPAPTSCLMLSINTN